MYGNTHNWQAEIENTFRNLLIPLLKGIQWLFSKLKNEPSHFNANGDNRIFMFLYDNYKHYSDKNQLHKTVKT